MGSNEMFKLSTMSTNKPCLSPKAFTITLSTRLMQVTCRSKEGRGSSKKEEVIFQLNPTELKVAGAASLQRDSNNTSEMSQLPPTAFHNMISKESYGNNSLGGKHFSY